MSGPIARPLFRKAAALLARPLSPAPGGSAARPRRSRAELERELGECRRELAAAEAQRSAITDVLQLISRSAFDLQTVLTTLVDLAGHLCRAENVQIFLRDGAVYRLAAHNGFSPEYQDYARQHPISPGRGTLVARTSLVRAPVSIPDALADPEYTWREGQRLAGFRALLGIPLLREGDCIGVLALTRQTPTAFTPKEVELGTDFADQAVIAIENVRLFAEVEARSRDLAEALEQQTATSEVLQVISRSTFDLQTVLDTLIASVTRLCDADHSWLFLREHDHFRFVASFGHEAEVHKRISDYLKPRPVPMDRGSVTGRTALEGRVVQVADVLADPDYTWSEAQRIGGYRAALGVPLLREGLVTGVMFIAKTRPGLFTERQVAHASTFADQAVIAIENTRLFDEVRTRTRELQEALKHQTATSDVLSVISRSPSEIQPVLDTIVATAAQLCAADYAFIARCSETECRLAASSRMDSEHLRYVVEHPITIDRGSVTGRVALDRATVHVADVLTDPEFTRLDWQRVGRQRTVLGVPLLREGALIGSILLSRNEVKPFTTKQVELVTTFAEQAVIAIENARLFQEVQARTKDLQEALEYQTATSEVLGVISRSPSKVEPVLQAIVDTAARLCAAEYALAYLREGDGRFHTVAANNAEAALYRFAIEHPLAPGRGSLIGRTALEGRPVHVEDCLADPEYELHEFQRIGRFRTMLGVPLIRDGVVVGALGLLRSIVAPFESRQVELVTTFADQAVIAIENSRLFGEVQRRTEDLSEALQQQTATADVLKTISRSTFDLQTVLHTLVESAALLCDAEKATITRQRDGAFYRAEFYGFSPDFIELAGTVPVQPDRGTVSGRALLEGKVVHIPDVQADPDYTWTEAQRLGDFRTTLGVPMLREGVPIGVLSLVRTEVRPFTERQIELVSTFADQAVIAIENARLFEEVQARTRELARRVRELQALGEVSQAVNSTLDLGTVLETIVAKAVQLSGTEAGAIYVYSNRRREFRLRATYGMDDGLVRAVRSQASHVSVTAVKDAVSRRAPVQVPDLRDEPSSPVRDLLLEAGYRGVLIVPLLRPDRPVGALVVRRREPGSFDQSTIELLTMFAEQSVLAIQNARLFAEIEEKGRELENASRHKSQFLANMSHELRTPLNSVLGFAEMMADGLYGELPERAKGALEKVERNGRHLLGLINDVLDLSKIEAGQLSLSLDDYSLGQLLKNVVTATEPLARAKGLSLNADVSPALPLGRGDERRLTQVVINLVGNAIKFTETGSVEIAATSADDFFEVDVRDTGPGIAPEDQRRIFEEFQQVDNSSTRKKGGTGLGLAISRRIAQMHGGTLTVSSVPGAGSAFRLRVPIRAEEAREAA